MRKMGKRRRRGERNVRHDENPDALGKSMKNLLFHGGIPPPPGGRHTKCVSNVAVFGIPSVLNIFDSLFDKLQRALRTGAADTGGKNITRGRGERA